MNTQIKYLSELNPGEEGYIAKVLGHGRFRKRINEMGFVAGKKVTVIKRAPLQDPVEYEIMGYRISLRNSEAEMIEIVSSTEQFEDKSQNYGTIDEGLKTSAIKKGKEINIALVGNPNCGKTTIFNYASGSHEHVGNYSGVTIDAKEATLKYGEYTINITDLPGTYSITEYSPEELYVRKHIIEKKPDIVVNVLDASNLDRNLFLTTQLIDMDIKVVIALNMFDELKDKDIDFRYDDFGKMIGIPVVPTIASKGTGIKELIQRIIRVYEDADPSVRHIHINYGSEIENAIKGIQSVIWENPSIGDRLSSRFLAIKLLEQDNETRKFLSQYNNYNEIIAEAEKRIEALEKEYSEQSETIITDAKYGFIDGALKETRTLPHEKPKRQIRKLDDLLTHKIWGFPIFFAFLFIIFEATFAIGQYPMDWIDAGVSWIGDLVSTHMPDGPLKDLIVDGVICGVGGVVVFLPNILILFFFISLMEDTGYMARAAFLMDKIMHKIGLHGKSFIPLIMGFGCNVPAVMATRTLENRSDRLLTMLIIPFMSCSARLPLYLLLIAAIFPSNQGLMLFVVYLAGMLMAVVMAKIFSKTLFRKKEVPFVMELPPYRIPTAKSTLIHMWEKGKQYLKKMGTVILTASIIIWALGYFPRDTEYSQDYDAIIAQAEANGDDETAAQAAVDKEAERQEASYIGRIGHAIEPIIKPLGFDWKIGVSLFSGMAAKEIVVSTMGILYQADEEADENSVSLQKKLQQQTYVHGPKAGEKVFTPLVALTLMIFVLIYFPCIATIVAIAKESRWKWAIFVMVYTTLLAYLVSLAVYQIGSLII
ncbi:MAG: ferrous iron transport protein B [Paludibacteraceae bacterium]|nr:ferrous iron transport protein B [Paludibacteraceae bacterium]